MSDSVTDRPADWLYGRYARDWAEASDLGCWRLVELYLMMLGIIYLQLHLTRQDCTALRLEAPTLWAAEAMRYVHHTTAITAIRGLKQSNGDRVPIWGIRARIIKSFTGGGVAR